MNTLFAKLSIALLLIVGGMGTAFFFIDRANKQTYYDELSQTLNAPIAMYVTDQRQLISNGVADLEPARRYRAGISGGACAGAEPDRWQGPLPAVR